MAPPALVPVLTPPPPLLLKVTPVTPVGFKFPAASLGVIVTPSVAPEDTVSEATLTVEVDKSKTPGVTLTEGVPPTLAPPSVAVRVVAVPASTPWNCFV